MPAHILTIDDEEEIRMLLGEALRGAGYRVTAVASAAEAMGVIQRDPPGLVITDLQLEDSDGFQLVERVKAVIPDVPVILLTAVLFDPKVAAGLTGRKIAAYVAKTASLEKILQEVRRQLKE